MSFDATFLLNNLSRIYPKGPGTNIRLVAEACHDGIFAEWETALVELVKQRSAKTATGGYLNRFGSFWGVPRFVGESDASFRLRIGQRRAARWGGVHLDELITLAATLLNTSTANVVPTENDDGSGQHKPRYVEFQINPAALEDLGLETSEYAGAIADLQDTLDSVAAGGVHVFVTADGTGIWDSSEWDGGETWQI